MDERATDIPAEALRRYIEEQIYSLPGVDDPAEAFTLLLTGSRATGTHTDRSDVDLEVLCPQPIYEAVHRAAFDAGIISTPKSFFVTAPETDWERYYGPDVGRPHFSVTSLEHVERHFRQYEDVWLWIWTSAQVIADPGGQFERIRRGFSGYPPEVLIRKIKYRWLLGCYWGIEVYPHHHASAGGALLTAATSLLNAVNEYLRVFFLVDDRPFPYIEKLMPLAAATTLGSEFVPVLQRYVDLVVGRADGGENPWTRLDQVFTHLFCDDLSEEARRLTTACGERMIAAGVDPDWVDADYANIDELLLGELGPAPS